MAIRGLGGRHLALGLGVITTALIAAPAMAADMLGRPTDRAIGLQPSGSELRDSAAFFHDVILMPTITFITLFVLALLVWVAIRYNKRRNPIPAKFAHNTPIEIVWTVVPVLILTVIAAFSFPLLYKYHTVPQADLTVKATGNQWFWSYEYPDQKIAEYTSNILPEAQAGANYKLATTAPLVVPVGKVTKVLVTGNDVLHAFFVPAFGVQITAVPGKVNQVWFKPRTIGTYYGQCNELCGIDHAFMPIEVKVVSQPDFEAWVAAHATKAAAVTTAPGTATPASASATRTPATPAPASAAPPASASPPAATPAAAPAAKA